MRDLYMKTGQGFLLVFSIASKTSFEELETLRDDIIRIKDDEDIPIVIVGNKADLEDQRAVDRAKAFSLSQRWGAPYYEASARTRSKYFLPHSEFSIFVNNILLLSKRRRGIHRPLPADASTGRQPRRHARRHQRPAGRRLGGQKTPQEEAEGEVCDPMSGRGGAKGGQNGELARHELRRTNDLQLCIDMPVMMENEPR